MNIQFRIHGLNADASLRAWLEQQLETLQTLIPITSAEVMLEHRRDAAPAFEAHVHLAVPGPDIHAAACDHTLEAAWLKVLKNLKKQIERRKTKQVTRAKTNRQRLRAELTQSCKLCSKHGCIDCTGDPAAGGSAHRHGHAAAAQQ